MYINTYAFEQTSTCNVYKIPPIQQKFHLCEKEPT